MPGRSPAAPRETVAQGREPRSAPARTVAMLGWAFQVIQRRLLLVNLGVMSSTLAWVHIGDPAACRCHASAPGLDPGPALAERSLASRFQEILVGGGPCGQAGDLLLEGHSINA